MVEHRANGTINKAAEVGSADQYSGTAPAKIDLSLAGNPWGPSPTIAERFQMVGEEVGYRQGAYPHIASILVEKIKKFHGIANHIPETTGAENAMNPDVYLGSGSTGIIQEIFNSGLISSGEYLVVPETTFPVPAGFAAQNSMGINRVSLTSGLRIDFSQMHRAVENTIKSGYKVSLIFMANPNNPTGYVESTSSIIDLAKAFPQSLVLVSEANIDYLPEATMKKIGGSLLDPDNLSKLPANIVVLRSFSKAYGLADDRVGYAVGDKDILDALTRKAASFKISGHSLVDAIIAIDDQNHVVKCRQQMKKETKKIVETLRTFGFPDVTQSESNLLVARVPIFFSNSDELSTLLHDRGCSVVSCGIEFGQQLAGKYIRVAAGTSEQNDCFLEILKEICTNKEREYLAQQTKCVAPPRSLNSILERRHAATSSAANYAAN